MLWSLLPNFLIGAAGMFFYEGVKGWIAYTIFTVVSFIPFVRWPALCVYLIKAQNVIWWKAALICLGVAVVYHWVKTILLAVDVKAAKDRSI